MVVGSRCGNYYSKKYNADASIRHENNTLSLAVGRKTLEVCRRCSGLNGLHSPSCALAFEPSSPFDSPEHSAGGDE